MNSHEAEQGIPYGLSSPSPSTMRASVVTRTCVFGPELFSFASERDWRDNAKDEFLNAAATCGVPSYDAIAVDARGRVCTRGLHFMEDKDAAYPIRVYAVRDVASAPVSSRGGEGGE